MIVDHTMRVGYKTLLLQLMRQEEDDLEFVFDSEVESVLEDE